MNGHLRFTPTELDLKHAFALHLARGRSGRWKALIIMFLSAALAAAYLSDHPDDPERALLVVGLVWTLMLVALIVPIAGRYLWMPRYVRRVFSQQKDLQFEVKVEWDAEEVVVANANSHSQVRWADLYRWDRSETTLVIYRSEAMFNFLPLKDAEAVHAADNIVTCLQKAGVPRRERV